MLWKMSWSFDSDCTESVDCLGYYGHCNNTDSSNPRTWHIFSPVQSSISFSAPYNFWNIGFLTPYVDLFLGFDVIVNGIIYLISVSDIL